MSSERSSILRGNLLVLGITSMLTDVSSEMIVPLLPIFLTATLGAPATALGVIEGVADATASVLKALGGFASDARRSRKPFVVFGYGLSSLVRPLIAIATSWHLVLAIRFLDRVGKGLRTAPRDDLLARSVPVDRRGEAFGFHRAMDHVGATIGPLLASAALLLAHESIRTIFAAAAIPGVLAVLVLLRYLREEQGPEGAAAAEAAASEGLRALPPDYWRALVLFGFLGLALSSDTFLLLRLAELGLPPAGLPLVWAGFHVIKSVANRYLGAASDRFGRRAMLGIGYGLYATSYLLFAQASTVTAFLLVFALYGLHYGFVEGVEKAAIADLCPAGLRGRGLGLYQGVLGLVLLPASAGFGALWNAYGAQTALFVCGVLALVGTIALPLVRFDGTRAASA